MRVESFIRPGTILLAMLAAITVAFLANPGSGGAQPSAGVTVDPGLKEELTSLGSGEVTEAIVTFEGDVSQSDLEAVRQTGVAAHTFEELPMVAVQGTEAQIGGLFSLSGAVSVWATSGWSICSMRAYP